MSEEKDQPMLRYRKRPVIVKAEQFFPNTMPWPKGVRVGDGGSGLGWEYLLDIGRLQFRVRPGDWIVGVGEFRHVELPDIFEATHERVSLCPGCGLADVLSARGEAGKPVEFKCVACHWKSGDPPPEPPPPPDPIVSPNEDIRENSDRPTEGRG